MDAGIVQLIKDPINTLGAIGQGIADTVDEEGTVYAISYVLTDVLIEIALEKGLGKVMEAGNKLDDVAKHADDVAKYADDIPANQLDELEDLRKIKDEEITVGEGGLTPKKVFTENPFDDAGNLKPNIKYETGEFKYNYETDEMGRISNWNTDDLRLTDRESRLNYDSNTPGKTEGDHAGHLAGDRFGGSPEIDNIVSQSQNVNLSQYKKIENQWAKAIEEGKEVTVNVDIKYDGEGLRPVEFNVEYTIDGKYYSKDILN